MSSKPINLTGVPLAEARRMMAAQRPKTASSTPAAEWLIEQLQEIADAGSSRDAEHLLTDLLATGWDAGWLEGGADE